MSRAVLLTTFSMPLVAREVFRYGGLAYIDKRRARFELIDAIRRAAAGRRPCRGVELLLGAPR